MTTKPAVRAQSISASKAAPQKIISTPRHETAACYVLRVGEKELGHSMDIRAAAGLAAPEGRTRRQRRLYSLSLTRVAL